MISAPELTPELFWQHSLAVYSKPGVAQACLTLQDDYQVNVNLLLFYHWCYCNQVCISPALRDALNRVIGQTDGAIKAHRKIRRNAKGTSKYEHLKQDELTLEAEQQAALVGVYRETLPRPERDLPDADTLCRWLVLPNNTKTMTLINAVLQA